LIELDNFQKKILNWYKVNKRHLPWRDTKDPYYIWLSEIILQQTRVVQGTPYYLKFISNFPKIEDLATAPEEKVLQLWQGLGYYSRGRNLHFTAKEIINNLNGNFPSTYTEILKLKGVGQYTAAAIASFSFNEKVAVLDGNVMRVLTRYFGLHNDISNVKDVNKLRALANSLLPNQEHSSYNQGIMEFGALQCVPKSPNCSNCPLSKECIALDKNIISKLPVKTKKIKVKKRFFNYIVFKKQNSLYLKKRIEKDIWQNLYDFPLIESEALLDFNSESLMGTIKRFQKSNNYTISTSEDFKHILSHQVIHARFFLIELNQEMESLENDMIKVKTTDLGKLGKPILIQNYLNRYIF